MVVIIVEKQMASIAISIGRNFVMVGRIISRWEVLDLLGRSCINEAIQIKITRDISENRSKEGST